SGSRSRLWRPLGDSGDRAHRPGTQADRPRSRIARRRTARKPPLPALSGVGGRRSALWLGSVRVVTGRLGGFLLAHLDDRVECRGDRLGILECGLDEAPGHEVEVLVADDEADERLPGARIIVLELGAVAPLAEADAADGLADEAHGAGDERGLLLADHVRAGVIAGGDLLAQPGQALPIESPGGGIGLLLSPGGDARLDGADEAGEELDLLLARVLGREHAQRQPRALAARQPVPAEVLPRLVEHRGEDLRAALIDGREDDGHERDRLTCGRTLLGVGADERHAVAGRLVVIPDPADRTQ